MMDIEQQSIMDDMDKKDEEYRLQLLKEKQGDSIY